MFFSRESCVTAIYELLDYPEHEGLNLFVKSKQALETYLWDHFPVYAAEHNAYEVSGNGGADMLEILLKELGVEVPEGDGEDKKRREQRKQEQRIKNCISYSRELAGQDFLLLP